MTNEKNTAPQILYKTPGESRLASVDFGGKLDASEVLTGTPLVTLDYSDPSGATAVTLSNKVISTAQLTINGRTVPIGEAVQFIVAGGEIDADYTIKVSATSAATPAQTVESFVHVLVKQE